MAGIIPSKWGMGSKRNPSDIVIHSKWGMGSKRNPSDIVIPSEGGGGWIQIEYLPTLQAFILLHFIFFIVLPDRRKLAV